MAAIFDARQLTRRCMIPNKEALEGEGDIIPSPVKDANPSTTEVSAD
jgi:hypothetical protein